MIEHQDKVVGNGVQRISIADSNGGGVMEEALQSTDRGVGEMLG